VENDTVKKLSELEAKIDAIYVSVEKTRKYILWTVIATVVVFVLPLVGLVFAIPMFMKNYVGNIDQMMGLMQ